MMFSSHGQEELVTCPYDSTHRMKRNRLQQHILKCQLNNPDTELKKCPFNSTHLVQDKDYVAHVTNCPDKKIITQYKYDPSVEPKEVDDTIRYKPVECEENWDDTVVEDYDPRKYAESAPVLRQPDSFQPAHRKEFVKTENERLGNLSADKSSNRKLLEVKKEEHVSDDDDEPAVSYGMNARKRSRSSNTSSRNSPNSNGYGRRIVVDYERNQLQVHKEEHISDDEPSVSYGRNSRERSRSPIRSSRHSPKSYSYGRRLPPYKRSGRY